jgi:creatinine amidohydrolase
MSEYDKFLMWKLTWPEVKENLESNDIVLVSVASTEQHGRHCPINTDAAIGSEICKRTLKKFYEQTGKNALLAAEINIGVSQHHISFPGTLTFETETLIRVIKDVCLSLIHHGFKKIIVVNSHGGNKASIEVALRNVKEATKDKKIYLFMATHWAMATDKWEEINDAGPTGSGHAGESETSFMMALGNQVRIDQIPEKAILPTFILPEFTSFQGAKYPGAFSWIWDTPDITKDGYMGDPTASPSAEKGEKQLEFRSDVFVEFLKALSKLK